MTDEFAFKLAPYVALALSSAALAARYVLARPRLAEASRHIRGSWPQARGVREFGLVVTLVVAGHLAGLLLPQRVLAWNAVPVRLYLLEACDLAVGLAALLCWAVAAWRYLADSTPSAIRHVADTVFFALMFVEVVSGLLTAILYRWASSWAVSTLTPYARSLFYGKPSAALVSGMPFVVQVHIVTTFLLLAVFPFTRIAALLIRGFDHGQVLLFRMAVAQVRAAGAVLTRRYNPSAWVWPEEEE